MKFFTLGRPGVTGWSLSSRRAWIEISIYAANKSLIGSLSSRRAWIEISVSCFAWAAFSVVLLAEGVD